MLLISLYVSYKHTFSVIGPSVIKKLSVLGRIECMKRGLLQSIIPASISLSVSLSVCHADGLCKTAEQIEVLLRVRDGESCGPNDHWRPSPLDGSPSFDAAFAKWLWRVVLRGGAEWQSKIGRTTDLWREANVAMNRTEATKLRLHCRGTDSDSYRYQRGSGVLCIGLWWTILMHSTCLQQWRWWYCCWLLCLLADPGRG